MNERHLENARRLEELIKQIASALYVERSKTIDEATRVLADVFVDPPFESQLDVVTLGTVAIRKLRRT